PPGGMVALVGKKNWLVTTTQLVGVNWLVNPNWLVTAMPVTLVRMSRSRQPVKETLLDAPLNTSIQSLNRLPSASRGSDEFDASTSLMTGWSATARAAESKKGGLVTARWPLSATHKASPL